MIKGTFDEDTYKREKERIEAEQQRISDSLGKATEQLNETVLATADSYRTGQKR